jgi:acetate CoA/acetoacetate CoA-transferase beta subunit
LRRTDPLDAQTGIAKRIALELRDGLFVSLSLSIGIPARVANDLPAGIRVFFQSENRLIGTGAPPEEGMHRRLLTDAGRRPVTVPQMQI